MKKFLAFMTALVSMLVLFTLSAFAAENVNAAKIGNTEYATVQDAVNAAQANDTITILCDIELEGNIVIPKDAKVTLDLAGKVISQAVNCTSSYDMICNNGTLYITDSVGGGKLSFTDTSDGDPTAGWGSYTVRNNGTLTVENVTIENLSAQNVKGQPFKHTTLAIFQYSGSCTINSGTISCPSYRSVRLWSGDMTINGGNFEGQVWVQCVNDTSELTINGGSFAPCGNDGSSVFVNNSGYVSELKITDGTFATKIGANDTEALAGSITGGSFSQAAITSMGTSSPLFATAPMVTEDGSYIVAVAQIGDNYYSTLQEAVNAAKNGEVIMVLCDIELDSSIVVSKGANVVIDLNGKTVSYVSDLLGGCMIKNNGTLTINDSSDAKDGAIVYHYIGETDSNYGTGNYLLVNNGSFTLNAGNVIAKATRDGLENDVSLKHAFYAIQNSNGINNSVTVNGGTIYNVHGYAIRLFGAGSLTVNGGLIKGTRAVWLQLPSSDKTVAPDVNVTIAGGTLTASTADSSGNSLAIYSYSYGNDMKNVTINISGGEFNGDIALTGGSNKATAEAVTITGGVFNGVYGDVYSYAEDSVAKETVKISGGTFSEGSYAQYYLADGCYIVTNDDGTLGVKVSLASAFVFVGYSIPENARDSVTAGFKVDHDVIALYCQQNGIEAFDFGCAFGVESINEKYCQSYAKYTSYNSFDVKIKGLDKKAEYLDKKLALALYVDEGNGKMYVALVDGEVQIVEASQVPTISFNQIEDNK